MILRGCEGKNLRCYSQEMYRSLFREVVNNVPPRYPRSMAAGARPLDYSPDDKAYRYSIVINCDVAHVYKRWLLYEDLPIAITPHCTLQKIGANRFLFTLKVSGGELKTAVRVLLRVPERRIAWQAESETLETGVLLFEPVSDHSTELTIRIRSEAAPLDLGTIVLECLANFKAFAEKD